MQFSLRRSRVIIRKARKMRPMAEPSQAVLTTPWSTERSRVGPFFLSLGLHLLIVTAVLVENYLRPPLELHLETPEQLLAEGRYELTWPVFPKDLPPVQPVEQPKPAAQPKTGDNAPPRFRLPQRVAANDPDAASRRQMIWDQAPQVELKQDVRSPNFVEPQLAAVQRPRFELRERQLEAPVRQALSERAPQVDAARPLAPDVPQQTSRLRYWTPEAQPSSPSKRALTAETAPRVQAAPSAPELAALQPDPKLRYWTEDHVPKAAERRALPSEAAPVVATSPGQGLDIGEVQKLSRLRYWTPEQGANQPGKGVLAERAPQIQAAPSGVLDIDQFQRLSRLRYQQAEDSSGAPAAPSREALAAVAEGSLDLGATGRGPTAQGDAADLIQAQALASLGAIAPPTAAAPGRAVVGADPDQTAPTPPRGNRGGDFTAGPDGGASTAGNGAGASKDGDAGAIAGVRIPNLSVTPASPGAPSGLSDARPPEPGRSAETLNTDRETLLNRFRDPTFTPSPTIGALAPERLPDPDFPFPGRAVYTLAVNMPNVNSYSGSWIIEFAEVKQGDASAGELSPPLPRVKVDPVYSRAAIDERIEGDVVLHAMIRSDGLVDHIKILRRLDARLDESAKVALSKWRFHPATKRGVPVDIETIVRIPFRLTGSKDKKR
jgi:TonB family protein